MPESLVSSLRTHQVAQAEEREMAGGKWVQGPGWVFPTRTGHLVRSTDDWTAWKDLLKRAGVRDARLHDARHTAASFMLANGVDGRVVMDILGWSRLEMMARYQHVNTKLQEGAVRKMGELLSDDQVLSGDATPADYESERTQSGPTRSPNPSDSTK